MAALVSETASWARAQGRFRLARRSLPGLRPPQCLSDHARARVDLDGIARGVGWQCRADHPSDWCAGVQSGVARRADPGRTDQAARLQAARRGDAAFDCGAPALLAHYTQRRRKTANEQWRSPTDWHGSLPTARKRCGRCAASACSRPIACLRRRRSWWCGDGLSRRRTRPVPGRIDDRGCRMSRDPSMREPSGAIPFGAICSISPSLAPAWSVPRRRSPWPAMVGRSRWSRHATLALARRRSRSACVRIRARQRGAAR